MMFSFKSLALAAGIAFAAISSVCATTPSATPTLPAIVAVETHHTWVDERSVVYVLEKAKYSITPVAHKFRK